jgi:hypothetical protein
MLTFMQMAFKLIELTLLEANLEINNMVRRRRPYVLPFVRRQMGLLHDVGRADSQRCAGNESSKQSCSGQSSQHLNCATRKWEVYNRSSNEGQQSSYIDSSELVVPCLTKFIYFGPCYLLDMHIKSWYQGPELPDGVLIEFCLFWIRRIDQSDSRTFGICGFSRYQLPNGNLGCMMIPSILYLVSRNPRI